MGCIKFRFPFAEAFLFITLFCLLMNKKAIGKIISGSVKKPPLVLIHGMKGSHLQKRKAEDSQRDLERAWLTTPGLLSLETPELSLPLDWSGNTQLCDDLEVGSTIDSVKIRLTKNLKLDLVPIYGPFMQQALLSDRDFFTFEWDWRRDLGEATVLLEDFLMKLSAKYDGQSVQVVAHSMGGLITLPIVNKKPELFAGIIFAGVPFGTGINYLTDIHTGYTAGFNKRMFAPHVLATFASHWIFFPENSKESDIVDVGTGEMLPFDFYTVQDWEKYSLGIFNPSQYPTVDKERYRNHLQNALNRAKLFRRKLVCKPDLKYPPIAVVSGNQHATVNQVLVSRDGSNNLSWDFLNGRAVEGDGRIDFAKSFPPEGIPYEAIASSAKHVNLLNEDISDLWQVIEDQAKITTERKVLIV
mmetsp:Transcript_35934/g.47422  ORF Transcript_35934/g.47422 Transcript_35934/m.47422 type:complete len:414 (-) Transcript_35934:88-1329(-)